MLHPGVRRARSLRFESLECRWVLSTFYVSTLGSDSSSGTADAPWRTLQKAANSVQAGDTVNVLAGNYAGFDLRTDGTAASPIVFRADPGVVINTRNPVTADGINLEGADYVTIDGFTVIGMPRAGIRTVTNHHVTIRNNVTDQNGQWGIFSGFSDDLVVEHNVASRSLAEHGIYVSNSGDRPIIRHNRSWGNYGAGIHMNGDASMGGDGIITGALVEGNEIYGNGRGGGAGINADGVQFSRFQNNLLYDNHATGVALFRQDGGGGSVSNVVVNNTVIQASDARFALLITGGSTGNTLLNNILYSYHSFRGSIDITSDSLAGLTSDYNVLMDRMLIDDAWPVLTLDQWQTVTGQDQHSLVAAPGELFVNAAGHDYHLSATSPALDAGTAQSAPPRDFDGNVRPSGTGVDMGAFERVVASPPTENRAPTDVLLSGGAVQENSSAGTAVGSLAAVDPDAGDTHTYALLDSAGGRFALSGSQLVLAAGADLNYEAATSHAIVVRATDGGGLSVDKALSISVQNVNEIVSFDVQRGARQRSYIRYVDLVFESSAGLTDLITQARVGLTRFGLDGEGGSAVSLSGKMTASGNRLSIDFGKGGIGGSPNSTSGNGYYALALDLDGNGSRESVRRFYRLLGDANGDRRVDSLDQSLVLAAMGQTGTNLDADVNGDGVVSSRDRKLVNGQLGKRLEDGLIVDD